MSAVDSGATGPTTRMRRSWTILCFAGAWAKNPLVFDSLYGRMVRDPPCRPSRTANPGPLLPCSSFVEGDMQAALVGFDGIR
ncbi:unnamed protein product [Peniophora sp. CBMAI 1063]|nr:unnamed protein product [Peniophora sp. CBMAI 1063]